jgi:hypothetical protein
MAVALAVALAMALAVAMAVAVALAVATVQGMGECHDRRFEECLMCLLVGCPKIGTSTR